MRSDEIDARKYDALKPIIQPLRLSDKEIIALAALRIETLQGIAAKVATAITQKKTTIVTTEDTRKVAGLLYSIVKQAATGSGMSFSRGCPFNVNVHYPTLLSGYVLTACYFKSRKLYREIQDRGAEKK